MQYGGDKTGDKRERKGVSELLFGCCLLEFRRLVWYVRQDSRDQSPPDGRQTRRAHCIVPAHCRAEAAVSYCKSARDRDIIASRRRTLRVCHRSRESTSPTNYPIGSNAKSREPPPWESASSDCSDISDVIPSRFNIGSIQTVLRLFAKMWVTCVKYNQRGVSPDKVPTRHYSAVRDAQKAASNRSCHWKKSCGDYLSVSVPRSTVLDGTCIAALV